MKKRIFLTLMGLVLICSLPACTGINGSAGSQMVRGSGTAGAEDRNVSNISGVELRTPGTLDITIGSSESLRIEADDNLLQYILTDVSGGRLVIKTRPGKPLQPVRPIKYHLSVIQLNSLGISSSGDITVPELNSGAFSIAISSSGNLSMKKLDCSSLRVNISSSGDANIAELNAKTLSVNISSSGNLSMKKLDCSSLRVNISSSGDANIAELNAKTLSVNISSSGNLDIAGGYVPKQTITISSSGEYRARDLPSENADVSLSSRGDATLRVSAILSGRLSSSGNINYVGNPKVTVNTSSSGRAKQIK
jgi:hypothetical protein